jgi:hypothetical protein
MDLFYALYANNTQHWIPLAMAMDTFNASNFYLRNKAHT